MGKGRWLREESCAGCAANPLSTDDVQVDELSIELDEYIGGDE